MVYFIQGKAKDIILDLKRAALLEKPEKNRNSINIDIPRTLFLGTRQELEAHVKGWQDVTILNHSFYWQGDMSAGNIHQLFPQSAFQKVKENETSEAYFLNKRVVSFAYVDKDGVLSGFSYFFRADDPSRWLMVATKNSHLPVEQRDVYVLTSFNPKSYLEEPGTQRIKVSSQTLFPVAGTIGAYIKSPCIEAIARCLVSALGQFNVNADVLQLCTQYVDSERFEENSALLQCLEKEPESILNNELLQKVNRVCNQLAPRQILDCLNTESPLCRCLLSLFKNKSLTSDERDKVYVALKMDKIGLLEQFGWIADDEAFLSFIKSLMNVSDTQLIHHFTTKQQVQFFRFLTPSPYRLVLARQLLAQTEEKVPLVWKAVDFFYSVFSTEKDDYIAAVVFLLLLKNLELGAEEITRLIKKLTPSCYLAQVFEPLDLANYIAQRSLNKQAEDIDKAQVYFANVLPKFELAAILRKKPLQPDFLKQLGKRYTKKQDQGIAFLAICENEEQIKACQILLELEFSMDTLAFAVVKKPLVAAVNHLDALNLKSSIKSLIVAPFFPLILKAMSKWPFLQQQALLIFLARGIISPEKIDELRQRFVEQPYLASLIISLHEKNYTRQQIQQLSSDPVKSRALHLLMTLEVPFKGTLLDSPCCHLLSLIHRESEKSLYKEDVKDYLTGILPELLNSQFTAPQDKPGIIVPLNTIIQDYQQVALLAAASAESKDWLLLLSDKHRLNAMAVALRQLDTCARPSQLIQTMTPAIFRQLLSYFTSLQQKPEDHVIELAVRALTRCYLEDSQASVQKNYLSDFMENPRLAQAVVAVYGQHLSVYPLLREDNQSARVELINHLSSRHSTETAHYQLAMENNEYAYDFRKIMEKVKHFPPDLETEGTRFAYDAITRRQTGGFFKKENNSPLAQEDTYEYGDYLAMRVLLINRFRHLGLIDSFVDLLLENSEKGKQFFNIITRIETRFQEIRARLQRRSSEKLASYLEPERAYRTAIYKLVYDALCGERRPDKQVVLQQLIEAEKPVMTIANEDRHPWLRKTLMIITNMLTLFFTATLANRYNEAKYGDFLFFDRTATSNSLNRLDHELAEMLGAPAA